MDLLHKIGRRRAVNRYRILLLPNIIFNIDTSQDIAGVVEARSSSFGNPDQALLLFILPYSG